MANILYVAQTYHPKLGGAERYIDQLADGMTERGHNVYVLAPSSGIDKDTKELERSYKVIRISFFDGWKRGIFYYLRAYPMALKINRLVRKLKLDVIHFQYVNPFALPVNILRMSGAKLFATVHGSGVHFMQEDWFGKRVLSHIFRGLDGVIPVSDYCEGLILRLGCPSNKSHVIYNGTNPYGFTVRPDAVRKNTILSVCRLVPRKDIRTLLQAVKILSKDIPDIHLNIVGDGPDKRSLEDLSRRLGLEKNVVFLGAVDDARLKELYETSAVFVLPAKYDVNARDIEGFGIVLLEAMAAGRPVIGADVGGIPSAISGDWGYLYKPEDAKQLSTLIRNLLMNEDMANKMGAHGRMAVENIYNWHTITHKLESVYGVKSTASEV